MTVKELIELLKKKEPQAQVFISVICYTPIRRYSPATKPVNDPLKSVLSSPSERRVFLIPDQEKVYG